MRKYDVAGIFPVIYGLVLVVMEFALLREPMPLYSRDNFEVGRVAVYSPAISYFTGFLILLVTWHLKAQKIIKEGSVVVLTSLVIGKSSRGPHRIESRRGDRRPSRNNLPPLGGGVVTAHRDICPSASYAADLRENLHE